MVKKKDIITNKKNYFYYYILLDLLYYHNSFNHNSFNHDSDQLRSSVTLILAHPHISETERPSPPLLNVSTMLGQNSSWVDTLLRCLMTSLYFLFVINSSFFLSFSIWTILMMRSLGSPEKMDFIVSCFWICFVCGFVTE